MLHRMDRPRPPVCEASDLLDLEAVDEAHSDDLLLFRRESLNRGDEAAAVLRMLGHGRRVDLRAEVTELGRELDRLTSRATVAIDQQVVSDPVEPRGKRNTLRPVPGDGIDHFQEHLLRKVFGIRLMPHAGVEISVDSIEMPVVKLG